MILYMYFDDWGREFTQHARDAICLDGTARRTPDEVLNDMSKKLAQAAAPNPPAFAVFLPCCFFTRDCQPHERTKEILIRAAERFKDKVAGIPNLVLPCVYADDLLESKAQDEESRIIRKSLDEFLAFLNREMAQAVRSIQNPCIDRVLLFEKSPYRQPAMDQYELFNCLENFLEVIRKDACTNLPRISIIHQLPILRGNPDLQGENIPFYGTLRMQKLEHPKAFFVARQASHDFLHILQTVTDRNIPVAIPSTNPVLPLLKPQLTIERGPLDLVQDWIMLKDPVYPRRIADRFGKELIKISEGARGVFPYSFGAWLLDRKMNHAIMNSPTQELMTWLLGQVGDASSFPKAEDGIDAAVRKVDEEMQKLHKTAQLQDGADCVRQPLKVLREARNNLEKFQQKKAVQERQINKWGLLFLFPLLFPLLGWLSFITVPDYGPDLPALLGIFADLLMVGLSIWALNAFYRRIEDKLIKALRDALDGMKLKLGARCNAYQDYTRDIHFLKYLKEFSYFLNRMKQRYTKLETYTHQPAATLRDKFALAVQRREDRFFKYIFDAGDVGTEENSFNVRLAKTPNYIQEKLQWPVRFMKKILTVLFDPPSHHEFLSIYGNMHREVVLAIDNVTGGGNLTQLINGEKLNSIMAREVPGVANVPAGILVDASRGGLISALYYQVYLCQASVMGDVTIAHTGFSPGPTRWDIFHDEPSIIIGHLAIDIRARDFCPQE